MRGMLDRLAHPHDDGGQSTIFPGVMIFLTVIAINAIGDALRDALDPYRVSGRAPR